MKAQGLLWIAGAALLTIVGTAGAALAAQTGQEAFAAKGCPACHGPDGKKTLLPTYPKLAGQNAPYLLLTLKAYKAQDRKGEQATIMWGMAAQLNDAEMQAVADFLSKVE
jgi:cytochrome c